MTPAANDLSPAAGTPAANDPVRVLRGQPTPAEVAALIAVLHQIAVEDAGRLLPNSRLGSLWADPRRCHRRPVSPTGWWAGSHLGG